MKWRNLFCYAIIIVNSVIHSALSNPTDTNSKNVNDSNCQASIGEGQWYFDPGCTFRTKAYGVEYDCEGFVDSKGSPVNPTFIINYENSSIVPEMKGCTITQIPGKKEFKASDCKGTVVFSVCGDWVQMGYVDITNVLDVTIISKNCSAGLCASAPSNKKSSTSKK